MTDETSTTQSWSEQTFTLAEYPEKLAIVKLGPGAEIPKWAESSSLFSVTATASETSLICAGRSVPTKTPSIRPLKAFRIVGELDPSAIGVLAALLVPLAEAGVPAYTFSTFETDWILVRVIDSEQAAEVWRRRGHTVTAAVPVTKAESRKAASPKNAPGKAAPRKKDSSR
ncbi:ACT domain-containing protein [Nocardioides sp. Iso805N]|uniref:ACT domain-containing protein n=1 Tax=Nocardioides sp. Iso805N TaxID=1283287 RepID=UPI00035EFC18|nr:ACT domain-containing protein [Nocardioides sp. Iso805N]